MSWRRTAYKSGNWSTLATWGNVGAYPSLATDVAIVDINRVNLDSGVPNLPCAAQVNAGGLLLLYKERSVANLHLNGGTLDANGYGYYGQGGAGHVHVDQDSYWSRGSLGGSSDRFALHGSGNLTLQGTENIVLYLGSGTDYSGTIIVANTNAVGKTVSLPSPESVHSFHLTPNGIVAVSSLATVAFTYMNRTMSGWGTLRTWDKYHQFWSFGLGSVLRPGAAYAPDCAVFTLKCYAGNEAGFKFLAGSKVVLDVAADGNDRIESIDAHLTKPQYGVVIEDGALLEIDLVAPEAPAVLTDQVLWNANAAINGTFSEDDITFVNPEGWKNLAVTKSADGKQILFSGEFVGLAPPGTVILVH